MDTGNDYSALTEKIKQNLSLKAFPIRDLVSTFREQGYKITLKTELTITDVHNTGDISGIMCVAEIDPDNKIACALTHLIFSSKSLLFREIVDYQKKRVKRINKLRKANGLPDL